MATFDDVTMVGIARDMNNTANALAREASRTGYSISSVEGTPSFVAASLYLDAIS